MATKNDIQIKIENYSQCFQYEDHPIFIHINQWEKHSVAKIMITAQQSRNDLREFFAKKNQDFVTLANKINKALNTGLDENIDLSSWTEKLNKLRQDVSDLSTCIRLQHNKNEAPIYLIKLNQNNGNTINKTDEDIKEGVINVPGTDLLTAAELSDLALNEQKQLLGERLFVLVQQIEPSLAAKITGMFLELEIEHILTLIKSHEILKKKVQEAINVLHVHQNKQRCKIKS